MRSLAYFIREAFRGFARNLSTALGSIVTIFLSLLIIGVFLIGGIIVENVVSSVENEVSITAFVADDAPEEDIQTVMNFVSGLEGVASVGFTTKEQALANFTATSNSDILETLDGQNPLPASIEVELSDPQLVSQVALQIESYELFRLICDEPEDPHDSLKYGQQTVSRLFQLTTYIRYIGIALIALLVFIALIFINNTIRLAIMARKKEIGIMRLVGASNGFIRGPFLMEAALHSIIGSLLAVGVLELVRRYVLPAVAEGLKFLTIDLSFDAYLMVYGTLVIAGLVIGFFGSMFAMGRYLKV